jgi:hypothetical protein
MVHRGEPNVKTGMKTTDGAPLQDQETFANTFIPHASRPFDWIQEMWSFLRNPLEILVEHIQRCVFFDPLWREE